MLKAKNHPTLRPQTRRPPSITRTRTLDIPGSRDHKTNLCLPPCDTVNLFFFSSYQRGRSPIHIAHAQVACYCAL